MSNKSSSLKKLYKFLSVILAAVFIISFTTAATYTDDGVLNEVRGYLKTYYVDPLPDSTLNLPTVDEIIKEINKTDPHTMYFTADKYKDFINSINNSFSGIGVSIQMVSDGVQVCSVYDGSPAKSAGLKPGDVIMMADNHMLGGLPDEVATGYIKGPEGTSVKLKVKRGTELLSFTITRKQINAPTVYGKILDKHIGYIEITSFGEDTATEFGQMLSSENKKKVDSYIIDLRYNLGGFLPTALDIAGYFVGNNTALITRDRSGEEKDKGVAHSIQINKPVIFLINEYSASASEILSAAVKDYNKAYFLGVTSYGKGSVQQPITLSNNDVLKMTIAKFYSPKGNTINKVGITPDMNIPDTIDSMRAAELILDTPHALKDTKGYVKITAKDKTVIVKLDRVENQDFWQSYKQLISLAATNGSVAFGNGKGYTTVSMDRLKNPSTLFYPNYKQLAKVDSASGRDTFSVKFDSKMLKGSINNKNVELIDASTGLRVPYNFTVTSDKEIAVSPKSELKKGSEYYLVVNPKVKKADNKVLGYGLLEDITTVK